MKRKEFEALPHIAWDREILCDALVILPTRRIHDSNYRCMDFVACNENEMVRVSGCSDVMHVDGIGGFGEDWLTKYGTVPKAVRPIGWSIDCLRVSGLLRIFASGYRIKCGTALSSFEFFAVPTE